MLTNAPNNTRRTLGLAFSSPAMMTVITTANGMRSHYIDDTVSESTVRERLAVDTTSKPSVFIIDGLRNMRKLGPRPILNIHVVVHDSPEIMAQLSGYIKIGDAKWHAASQRWEMVQIDIDTIMKRVAWSAYSAPINPKIITNIRAQYVPELPSNDKKFDPIGALNQILSQIKTTAVQDVESSIYEFMAGLSDRREFGALRRKAPNNAKVTDVGSITALKVNLATFQRWMESEDGRLVSGAYQLSAKQAVAPAEAALRVGAHVGMLMRLVEHIPPSRRQTFKWVYVPKEA